MLAGPEDEERKADKQNKSCYISRT